MLALMLVAPFPVLPPVAAAAQVPERGTQVEIVPVDGSLVEVEGQRHAGRIRISGHSNGLAVVETTTVDDYLLGIKEVPFGWPMEALRAQVVAARTYLAWTLDRGRSDAGRRYGYDICATTACQVYAGLDAVLAAGGDRWRRAVESTANLILVHDGGPAQALYSSTSGGRTRAVEDVFPGADPSPYLQAVSSPGEESPFVRWSYRVSAAEMTAMLSHAGLLEGELVNVRTETTGDGQGPWMVVVEGSAGITSTPTWRFRTAINRAAAELFPDRFPALRLDGSGYRYPQTVLSPTYTVAAEDWLVLEAGADEPRWERWYRFSGRGWGHLVGMSQYGAEAMAQRGADAADILAHFYGGLRPEPAGDLLPPAVAVGLGVGREEVLVRPLGPVDVLVDGQRVAEGVLGSWRLGAAGGGIAVEPPAGLGSAPVFEGVRARFGPSGKVEEVAAQLAAPAELRVVAQVGGVVTFDSGWRVVDAGRHLASREEITGGVEREAPIEVRFLARSPQGSDTASLRLLPGLE